MKKICTEDERIRKEIIDFVKSRGGFKGDWLAWLEKQGKEEYALKSFSDKDVHKFMQYIEKQAKAYDFNLPNRGYDIYAFAKDILHWLEKQGEKKDYYTKQELIDMGFSFTLNGDIVTPDKMMEDMKKYLAWKEKHDEQKQADTPKFKVRDWILNDVCFPMQIASIRDGMYVFTDGSAISVSFVDENYHLWTIADAMDGDVLVSKDNRPFIFTGEFDVQYDNPTAYCGINSSDKFITGMGSHWTLKNGIKPATKEQRDLLFSKMKEAGCEWDSEKKELKKIEQGNHPRIVTAQRWLVRIF